MCDTIVVSILGVTVDCLVDHRLGKTVVGAKQCAGGEGSAGRSGVAQYRFALLAEHCSCAGYDLHETATRRGRPPPTSRSKEGRQRDEEVPQTTQMPACCQSLLLASQCTLL